MLRGWVLALLVANLMFFAWSHGQEGRTAGEPDRRPLQVHPEAVRLLKPVPSASTSRGASSATDSAANAASAPNTTRCLEAGPFNATEATAAEAALAASPAASALAQRWSLIAVEAAGSASAASTLQRLRIDAATPDEAAALASLPAGLLPHTFAPCANR